MEKIIIIGLGATADHVYEFINMYKLYEVIGFAVNENYKKSDQYLGLPIYTLEHLNEEYGSNDFNVFVALLWNNLNGDRKRIYNYCKSKKYKMVNLISPYAIIRGKINGDNCWIHDYVVVQNDALLESNIAIMAFSLIGASTHVESHCFFGARSLLAGGCVIGEQSFVGINSTIFDDTKIGKKCIIGACTAVKRNVPDYSKYTTSSDNITIKQYSAEEIESKLVFTKNKR